MVRGRTNRGWAYTECCTNRQLEGLIFSPVSALRGGDGDRSVVHNSSRAERQSDPQNDVREDAGSGEEHGEQPANSNNRYIEIEIVRKAGAHAGDFLVRARAHQSLFAANVAGHTSPCGRLLSAAVIAKVGIVGDVLLAVRADHDSLTELSSAV